MWKPLENKLFPCFCFHNAYMLCYSLLLVFFLTLYLQMYLVMLVSSAVSTPCQFKSLRCDYWMSLTKRFYLFTASVTSFWPPPIYEKLVWDSFAARMYFRSHAFFFYPCLTSLIFFPLPACDSTLFPNSLSTATTKVFCIQLLCRISSLHLPS